VSSIAFVRRLKAERVAVPVAYLVSAVVILVILGCLGPVVALSVTGGLVEVLGIAITTGWVYIPKDPGTLRQTILDYLTNTKRVPVPPAGLYWWDPPSFGPQHQWLRRVWAVEAEVVRLNTSIYKALNRLGDRTGHLEQTLPERIRTETRVAGIGLAIVFVGSILLVAANIVN
jgi:hypothetical protein